MFIIKVLPVTLQKQLLISSSVLISNSLVISGQIISLLWLEVLIGHLKN